jgi:hypothetical protein
LFEQLLPSQFLEHACQQAETKFHNSVFNPLVVMWLLVWQRLHGAAPLQAAVLDLLQDLPACFWPNPCKRVRDWQQNGKGISGHSAAYNQARQRLPFSVVAQSADRIFDQLMGHLAGVCAPASRRAFLLDGTSMRMVCSPALAKSFPRASNQHGESHWPVMRVLVAHDLQTGLAMRPQWGPMYGSNAVSEQQLLEGAIARLPQNATVIGDCNFGVFSVVWTATQKGYPVVLRLTAGRARSLAGEPLHNGIDRQLVWEPSRADRKRHPDLPPEACLGGRLIVRQVQPDHGGEPFLLALFTTLTDPVEEILKLYGQRWRIETDLRTLKSQLRLEQLSCATPDMAAKEIVMGITAYNLVRAVIALAARQSGLPPRHYSFTSAARILQSFAPKIANASTPEESKRHFDRMMYYLQQTKLPRRTRKPYPREVWSKQAKYPKRKT